MENAICTPPAYRWQVEREVQENAICTPPAYRWQVEREVQEIAICPPAYSRPQRQTTSMQLNGVNLCDLDAAR